MTEAVSLWETVLMEIVDEFAPIRRRKKRVRNKPAPWLNTDIKKLMKKEWVEKKGLQVQRWKQYEFVSYIRPET